MQKKIDQFLSAATNLKPSSKQNYRYKLTQVAKFLNFKRDFNEDDIIAFLNSKKFLKLKISSQNLYKNILRKFLKFHKMNFEFVKTTRVDPEVIRKEDLLTKDEINKILKNMLRPLDKLLFMMGLEAGPRAGELRNIKLKDVADRETHFVVYISESKSKRRPLYLVESVPFLIDWLNQHPDRENPEQYLFCHRSNGSIGSYTVRGLEKILARNNAISKRLFPHLLRHTAVSRDKKLSEKEKMMKYGWKSRAMIDRYEHLTYGDLEKKILQLHGILPEPSQEENEIELIENVKCPRCAFVNPGTNKFCSRCGSTLDLDQIAEYETDKKILRETYEKEELYEMFKKFVEQYQKEKKSEE